MKVCRSESEFKIITVCPSCPCPCPCTLAARIQTPYVVSAPKRLPASLHQNSYLTLQRRQSFCCCLPSLGLRYRRHAFPSCPVHHLPTHPHLPDLPSSMPCKL